jgi:hypothetical protein
MCKVKQRKSTPHSFSTVGLERLKPPSSLRKCLSGLGDTEGVFGGRDSYRMYASKTLRARIDSRRLNRWAPGLGAEELIDRHLVAIDPSVGAFPLAGRDVVTLLLHAFERQTRFG